MQICLFVCLCFGKMLFKCVQEAKKNLHTVYQITGLNFPEQIAWCTSKEHMKLLLRMEKGAWMQKDFMMCFSEYLAN